MSLAHALQHLQQLPLVFVHQEGREVCACAPGDHVMRFSLDDDATCQGLHAVWRSARGLVLMRHAQPMMRSLQRRGIDVARPVCLKTLSDLSKAPLPEFVMPHDDEGILDLAHKAHDALDLQLAALEEKGLRKVARLECLVLRAIAALEVRGLALDKAGWQALVDEAKTNRQTHKTAFFDAMGDAIPRDLFGEPDFHIDSDDEIRALFTRVTGEEVTHASKWALGKLDHPAVEPLLHYREANKVVTTYGDSFLAHVDDDGRVRAEFIPLGASTGRFSSRNPNLQNLPGDTRFHACLRAPEGRKLITADYGTCELRILAEMSQDERFLDFFNRGADLHAAVASRLFKENVTKESHPQLRQQAKAINFGLCYGMGAASLASQLDLTHDDAERLLNRYFDAFPGIAKKLESLVDDALRKGYAETLLGRKMEFDKDVLQGPNPRGELGRIAKNMPIQGTSADMTKLAMVLLTERLQPFDDAGLVNTIHDELVVECAAAELDEVKDIVVGAMTDAHNTLLRTVPVLVDIHAGDIWQH